MVEWRGRGSKGNELKEIKFMIEEVMGECVGNQVFGFLLISLGDSLNVYASVWIFVMLLEVIIPFKLFILK